MRPVVALLVKLVLVAVLAGCGYPPLPNTPPREVVVFPAATSRDLDLLFLIDDSPSMADKQSNLANTLALLTDRLGVLPGGLPNLHVSVATSDLGTQGALDTNPNFGPTIGAGLPGACAGIGKDGVLQVFGAPVSGNMFVSDIADPVTGTRTRNYTGALTDVLTQMTKAGVNGCGFEQHLAAIKRALLNPGNQGFLRPDANLGVIILADEDDCSLAHYALLATDATSTAQLGDLESFRCTRFGVLCNQGGQDTAQMNQAGAKDQCHPNDDSQYLTKINDYATFLQVLKSDPNKVTVAGIVGPTEPFAVEMRAPASSQTAIPALAHSCSYTGSSNRTEVADPAIRIKAFLDQFPHRSAFVPICQDLSGGLQQIGDLLKTALGYPCFSGPLDSDPKTPGMQYDCTVTAAAPGTSTGIALPRCTPENVAATNQPCWHITADAALCPSGDHLAPVIEGRASLAQAGSYVTASCVAPAMPPGA